MNIYDLKTFLFCISSEFLKSMKEKTNINIISYPPFYSLSEVLKNNIPLIYDCYLIIQMNQVF